MHCPDERGRAGRQGAPSCKACTETSPDTTLYCVQLLLAKSSGLAVQSGSGDDSPLLARGMPPFAEASQVEDSIRQHMAALSGRRPAWLALLMLLTNPIKCLPPSAGHALT